MNDKTKPQAPEQVQCETCLKEIPRSEARSNEASDYVAYFCGLDCYDKWKGEKELPKNND